MKFYLIFAVLYILQIQVFQCGKNAHRSTPPSWFPPPAPTASLTRSPKPKVTTNTPPRATQIPIIAGTLQPTSTNFGAFFQKFALSGPPGILNISQTLSKNITNLLSALTSGQSSNFNISSLITSLLSLTPNMALSLVQPLAPSAGTTSLLSNASSNNQNGNQLFQLLGGILGPITGNVNSANNKQISQLLSSVLGFGQAPNTGTTSLLTNIPSGNQFTPLNVTQMLGGILGPITGNVNSVNNKQISQLLSSVLGFGQASSAGTTSFLTNASSSNPNPTQLLSLNLTQLLGGILGPITGNGKQTSSLLNALSGFSQPPSAGSTSFSTNIPSGNPNFNPFPLPNVTQMLGGILGPITGNVNSINGQQISQLLGVLSLIQPLSAGSTSFLTNNPGSNQNFNPSPLPNVTQILGGILGPIIGNVNSINGQQISQLLGVFSLIQPLSAGGTSFLTKTPGSNQNSNQFPLPNVTQMLGGILGPASGNINGIIGNLNSGNGAVNGSLTQLITSIQQCVLRIFQSFSQLPATSINGSSAGSKPQTNTSYSGFAQILSSLNPLNFAKFYQSGGLSGQPAKFISNPIIFPTGAKYWPISNRNLSG